MTTASTITSVTCNSQLVGGPKILSFTAALISGDDTGSFDLKDYFAKEILHIVSAYIFTAAAGKDMVTQDIATTPTTFGCTFTDPAADGVLYVTALGY